MKSIQRAAPTATIRGVSTIARKAAPTVAAVSTVSRAAPAAVAKELQIGVTDDGRVVLQSSEDGASVAYAVDGNGEGLTVTEVLADGSEGESVNLQPAPAEKPADSDDGDATVEVEVSA